MRDRLIELIENANWDWVEYAVGECEGGKYPTKSLNGTIADALLADGWIRSPVKVGKKVYIISRNKVKECEVDFIGLSVAENWSHFSFIEPYADGTFYKTHSVHFSEIGKTVFLTREEAEQALKGGAE